MKRCGDCGVPKRVSAKHHWRDNGVIVTQGTELRGIFVESGLLCSVLSGIEERLGIPIEHIIIDAKRRDAKIYVDNMLKGARGRLTRMKLFRRAAYSYMVKQAAAIGLAEVTILDYRPGESLDLEMGYVYNPALFAGDVSGAFESIEGVRAKVDRTNKGGSLQMTVRAWPEAPEEERLKLEEETWAHALTSFQRCPSCGVPRELSRWRWSVDECRISDEATGEWLIYVDTAGINAVFRELERELGEDIPKMVADLSRDFYVKLDGGKGAPFLRDLRFLEYRGFGVPESMYPVADNGNKCVAVRNPWNAAVVAGCVAAACGLEGSPVNWEAPKEGRMTVILP